MEKLEPEVYSLHRYIDESGAPDYEKIFSKGDSKYWAMRHIDHWLLGHFYNQPEIIRKDPRIKRHLESCEECRSQNNPEKKGEQAELFNSSE